MTQRFLPPLEAGTTYRVADFQSFQFEARSLHKSLTGEDVAILQLCLANKTRLDLPIADDALVHLMRILMEAHPREAIDHAKMRKWT